MNRRVAMRWVPVVLALLPLSSARAIAGVGPSRQTRPSPTARCCMEMAQDRTGQLIVFGGESPKTRVLGDTWTFDGAAWTRLDPPVAPTPRCCYAFAYDQTRRETVLFGGSN